MRLRIKSSGIDIAGAEQLQIAIAHAIKLMELEHARELERDLVRVAEQEQMRLREDLHDGVCQTLAALDCAAECLGLDLEADDSARVAIATENIASETPRPPLTPDSHDR